MTSITYFYLRFQSSSAGNDLRAMRGVENDLKSGSTRFALAFLIDEKDISIIVLFILRIDWKSYLNFKETIFRLTNYTGWVSTVSVTTDENVHMRLYLETLHGCWVKFKSPPDGSIPTGTTNLNAINIYFLKVFIDQSGTRVQNRC